MMDITTIIYIIAGVVWGLVALFTIAMVIVGIIKNRRNKNNGNVNTGVARGFGSYELSDVENDEGSN